MVSSSGISSNSLPHILLIVTDQLRFDAFNPQIMEHLSRIDSNSNTTTLFTNAFVSTPSCTPEEKDEVQQVQEVVQGPPLF